MVDYINHKRLHKSLQLLATTDLMINAIAEKVGYLDENYFTRMFKRQYGKAPREYRKTLQQKLN